MATLPQGAETFVPVEYMELPTKTFIIDWSTRQIAGTGSGIQAMRQAVEIILNTERFWWQIYSSNFGAELESLPGEALDYIQSELPRRMADAFSVDSRIISVDNYIFNQGASGILTVTFDVHTVYGDLREEVKIGND